MKWAKNILNTVGAKLEIEGAQPKDGRAYIYVSNHRSWADIPIILSLVNASMLSKAEVADYPILGPAAEAVGTIFVKREERQSRAASLEVIADHLKRGGSAALFPEGSTSPADAMREWKPGVFLLAAKNNLPVVPVALHYKDPRYVWGDEPITDHFLRSANLKKLEAFVSFHAPITNEDPARLKEAAESTVRETLERRLGKLLTIIPTKNA